MSEANPDSKQPAMRSHVADASVQTARVNRRGIFAGAAAGLAAATLVPAAAKAQSMSGDSMSGGNEHAGSGYVQTKDGVEIFYKDWGPRDAQPIHFHHGWPLSADDWDPQMLFFLAQGYRVVAHDRRGHGRSTQVYTGNDMDHYAADASAVAEYLDLKNAVHIGHSTGGGEVARYVAKFGQPQGRVAKAVLISSVPPLMLKTASNPKGTPIKVFDGFREALAENRPQFYLDVASGPFYGFNRPGAKVSQGIIDNWYRQGMEGGAIAQYQGIKAFSETDQTADLKAITVPTLIMQGTDDQVVPYEDASQLQAQLIKNSTLKLYKGYPHGMMTVHSGVINNDILAFIKG
jgi:non-heme chloroperoxidase